MTTATTAPKSLLTMPSDLEAPNAITFMLYGQPGCYKTTTALSAPGTVCIDFDNGMHRVEPQYRRPSLQVTNYQKVLDLLNTGELDPFDTIIIDTAGKLVDRIAEHVIKLNPKNGAPGGGPSLQGWGAVRSEFGRLVKELKLRNKSLGLVAHESEEKNGDETIKRPDIAGSARKDIVKELDCMGYMERRGTQSIISFTPTDKFYAKNSLGLDDSVMVPELKDNMPNNFLASYLFKASAAKLEKQNALRKEYEQLVFGIDALIASLKTVEEVNAFYAKIPDQAVIWDSTHYTKNALLKKTKELGIEWDGAAKVFKVKAKDTAAKAAGSSDGAAAQVAPASTTAAPSGDDGKKAEINDDAFSQQ